MISWLKHLLISEDDNDPKFVNLLRNTLTVVMLVIVLLAIVQSGILSDSPQPEIFVILTAISILMGVCVYLVTRKILWPGKLFLPTALLIVVTYFVATANGLHDVAVIGFPVIILFASLMLGRKTLLFWAIATSVCIGFVGYWDMAGFTPEPIARTTGFDTILIGILVVMGSAGITNVLLRRFEEIIAALRQSQFEQIEANQALRDLQVTLEQRVDERTIELEQRANQLNAIANVARSTASLQDLEDILPSITQLVSERFGFYHVGIFLLDNEQGFAVLRAANSDGGKRMLERQHKLKLDTQSIVGFVTSRGEPRIALDVGADAVFFNNPNLPDTRSEMALPLRVGGNVIGALDVQSMQPNAFTEGDVSILSTLADQVAIAIENARLFSDAREALRKSEETFNQYVSQEWSSFTKGTRTLGYKFDGIRTEPMDTKNIDIKTSAIQKTGNMPYKMDASELSIPIRFRGKVIGMFDVKPKSSDRKWTSDDIALLEAAAERTALALENARLVESSQMRASREHTIGEISTRIGAANDIDAIMQTVVEELGRKIGSAMEVTFELDTGSEGRQN